MSCSSAFSHLEIHGLLDERQDVPGATPKPIRQCGFFKPIKEFLKAAELSPISNVIASLFPDLIDDRQKSLGPGHFGLVRAFATGQPFVKAAQVKIHLNPLSSSWEPAQPPVSVPDLINLY